MSDNFFFNLEYVSCRDDSGKKHLKLVYLLTEFSVTRSAIVCTIISNILNMNTKAHRKNFIVDQVIC